MGLDEREKRILKEIERQFYAEDPALASAVNRVGPLSRHIPKSVAVVLLVAGLATTIGGLLFGGANLGPIIGLVGFGLMVVSVSALAKALWLEARRVGAGSPNGDETEGSRHP